VRIKTILHFCIHAEITIFEIQFYIQNPDTSPGIPEDIFSNAVKGGGFLLPGIAETARFSNVFK
jgi:hypothetical protein